MIAPLVLAQTIETGQSAGWLIIGGALAVLGIGIAIVVMAKVGSRRDELEERLTVRNEAIALSEPVQPPSPAPKRPPSETFIDLPGHASPEVVDLRDESPKVADGRRSPLAAYAEDFEQQETFVDLPASSRDPIVDLTDESVDLTEEREEARPKRDPWA